MSCTHKGGVDVEEVGGVHREIDRTTGREESHHLSRKAVETKGLARLLTPAQAAQYLGVSVRTLRRLFYKGHFGAIRSRNFMRYDRLDLDRWIDDQKERVT